MLTYNRQFLFNTILFVVACVVLGLSIWALVAKCKNDNFGNSDDTYLKCDFSNKFYPINVNTLSGGCSTSDVTGVANYIKNNLIKGLDILLEGCYEENIYKLKLSNDEANKLCNYISN